jgi:hypothetical protein
VDPDRLDQSRLEDLRRELAGLSDAALATAYERYRVACGLRTDGVPAPGDDAALLVDGGRVSAPPIGAILIKKMGNH